MYIHRVVPKMQIIYKNETRVKAAQTRVAAVVAEKKDVADEVVGSRRPHALASAPPLIVSLRAAAPGDVKYKTFGVDESVFKRIGPFDTASEGSILRDAIVRTGR
mmetsp:Transcript_3702/g.7870  ORF Transcript_3702/g.7870 Transcript_3702/m.7870 type:complete len:105 (+) Transcript_3702:1348-1662(+)